MNFDQLVKKIHQKKSFLCVGLDPDINYFPLHLRDSDNYENYLEFNKKIIDATRDLCVAYKLNVAFYESLGMLGWQLYYDTIQYIGAEHFIISDAKRGDIGNTSKMYAKTFFETFPTDAITVSPYMGSDSVAPFYQYEDKWVIILALTSNAGSEDFQMLADESGNLLFEKVISISKYWGTLNNTMYVVGATHPKEFKSVRKLIPDHFLLVPGVGRQGGNFSEICKHAINDHVGLLINVSRDIIYASQECDFENDVRRVASDYQNIMQTFLERRFEY
ncbi:MAG: orotidine-5'-phosphate decarboxylase [Saprospiraceae bacterium]|nr:orotidine-5'-phosphate decarboxylase [Saprospiraceae bacterium]